MTWVHLIDKCHISFWFPNCFIQMVLKILCHTMKLPSQEHNADHPPYLSCSPVIASMFGCYPPEIESNKPFYCWNSCIAGHQMQETLSLFPIVLTPTICGNRENPGTGHVQVIRWIISFVERKKRSHCSHSKMMKLGISYMYWRQNNNTIHGFTSNLTNRAFVGVYSCVYSGKIASQLKTRTTLSTTLVS